MLAACRCRVENEGFGFWARKPLTEKESNLSDLDILLQRLGEQPAPDGLASTEAAVFQRVHGYSFYREPLRFRVAAVIVALLMGVAGAMLPESGADASQCVAPLGEAVDLAPSTLPVDGR